MSTDDDPDLCNDKRSRGVLKATIEIGRLAQVRLGFLITSPKEGICIRKSNLSRNLNP